MSFNTDTSLIPQITCYEDAIIRFENARHIRGTHTNQRRLCDIGENADNPHLATRGRRQKHKLLLKHKCITKPCDGEKEFDGTNRELITRGEIYYQVQLHSNAIAEFYPDYYQINLAGWESDSTIGILQALTSAVLLPFNSDKYIPDVYVRMQKSIAIYHKNNNKIHTKINFPDDSIEEVLPIYSYATSDACRVLLPNKTWGGTVKVGTKEFNTPETGYLINDNNWYQFNYDGTPHELCEFAPFYKYLLDKKELYKARKNVLGFMNYVKATLRLSSQDGGLNIPLPDGHNKRAKDKSESQNYYLIYWYCLVNKSNAVKKYLKAQDEANMWGEMLEALIQWNAVDYNSEVLIARIENDLDKIIKHANPRTLVRVS